MDKKIKTIAIQVDDWDFIGQYEKRVRESGMSLKNYLIGLMKADIALNQTQDNDPARNAGGLDETIEPEQAEPADIAEQPVEAVTHENTSEAQTGDPGSEQDQTDAPAAPEDMMNLFVKITKEQREALEAHKTQTGETVGSVLNRLIDGFLEYSDDLPEGFNEAYQHYTANIKSCDTTCSAKIPARVNQELTDYLDSFGGLRNALIASLVELELNGQMLAQDEEQGAGIQM